LFYDRNSSVMNMLDVRFDMLDVLSEVYEIGHFLFL
jgi:hypothetical protein